MSELKRTFPTRVVPSCLLPASLTAEPFAGVRLAQNDAAIPLRRGSSKSARASRFEAYRSAACGVRRNSLFLAITRELRYVKAPCIYRIFISVRYHTGEFLRPGCVRENSATF